MQTNVIDISEELVRRAAKFLMNDDLVIKEAELNARLSHFPEEHVVQIYEECKRLKGVA